MSAGTPPFTYTCELCGLDGMSEAAMRAHTLARHVAGRPTCPFCDLADIQPSDLLLHVNQAHLDYLTPEIELMAFIDDQSPGYDEDSKAMTDSCSYTTPSSVHNGWHSPDIPHNTICNNGAISKNLTHSPHHANQSSHNANHSSHLFNQSPHCHQSSCHTNQSPHHPNSPQHNGYRSDGKRLIEGRHLNNINTNGVLPKTKKKIKSRESSVEDPNDHISNHSSYDNASKKVVAGAGQGSPLRSQLALKLKANTPKKNVPTPSPTVQCLMCDFTSSCPQKLEEHMNRAHFDLTSPSVTVNDHHNPTIMITESQQQPQTSKYSCPICDRDFPNGSEIELHVNIEHKDILSPQNSSQEQLDNARGGEDVEMSEASPCTTCPVCCQPMPPNTTQQEMMEHIEEHFERGEESVSPAGMTEAEREAQRTREQEEFQQLRAQYGMEEGELEGGYSGQAANSLRRAVYSGALSVAGYYERSIGLRKAGTEGVEDGASCTKGLLERILAVNATQASIARSYLCSAVDHYASTYGDRGWGCGYRNMQMVISGLLQHTGYNQLVWSGAWDKDSHKPRSAVPSIPKLQLMVEKAWQMGFDIQGSEQLGCKLYNTRKWIGACEVVTVLSSLRIRCQLIDFHKPTGMDGGHPALFDWVLRYFTGSPDEFKPPLYLQHQGHSRTIIGYERHRDGKSTLLILDPSHAPAQVRQILCGEAAAGAGALRLLRRGPAALRAKQYQLVAITGVISSDEEYEASKVLQSIRIPGGR